MKGVLHYELLKPGQTITADRYRQQLLRLNEEIELKYQFTGKGKRPVKLIHDNARSHVGKPVKDTLMALMDGKFYHTRRIHQTYIAPTDFHLFRKMQNELSAVRFKTFEQVQKWVDDFLVSHDETYLYT